MPKKSLKFKTNSHPKYYGFHKSKFHLEFVPQLLKLLQRVKNQQLTQNLEPYPLPTREKCGLFSLRLLGQKK